MSQSEQNSYTANVAARYGPDANPRAVEIFSCLIRHLHHFAQEVELTNEEWMFACESLVSAGKISGAERNEMILISDVLGLEALLDTMTTERFHRTHHLNRQKETASTSSSGLETATMSAILGPFYRDGAPHYKNGESIVKTHHEDDTIAYLSGRVLDVSGNPIIGAELTIWHDGSQGLYDSQLYNPEIPDEHPYYNWRGVFTTEKDGKWSCLALRPTPYPIPYDNVAGAILKAMDNSPMRPAHIHFVVRAEGYRPLVTQVYDADCKWLDNDSVFAVKNSLIVQYKPTSDKSRADVELEYDFVLVPESEI